ncbi:hypothetical protein N7493_009051 [Penicillium malachiteum]|uniref:Uncharacterized protein n=1 Tax=Penicillium malachiteum TaxID=1324776 RepID=A0AAD6HFR4_9EURO|nr:hypothetical protein N7493_009051 [Penicillium malachiteum]
MDGAKSHHSFVISFDLILVAAQNDGDVKPVGRRSVRSGLVIAEAVFVGFEGILADQAVEEALT